MKKLKLKIGDVFGRLFIVKELSLREHGHVKYVCQCECGNIITALGSNLVSGKTKSCGCLRKEITRKRRTTHGMKGTREWSTWQSMKKRCYNLNSKDYKYYGGRGIFVCRRWRISFENFHKDMGDKPEGLSIDRIDNNQSYGKWNCRWVTMLVQNNNKGKHYE